MITDLQMIIIVILTAVVAAGLGMLWGVSRYTHIYDWFSASFFSRMQEAMKGLGYSQAAIDNLLDKMGQKVMLNIPPPPTPPVKDGDVESTRKVILEEQGFKFDGEHIVPIEEIKGNNGEISHNFKVGNWIVDSTDRRREPMQIKNILDVGYTTEQGSFIDFKEENNFRLWTIEDAKDGDVLYSKAADAAYIFKAIDGRDVRFYCDCDFSPIWKDKPEQSFGISDGGDSYGQIDDEHDIVTPATKEQCKQLFDTMHKAGYVWDAENKRVVNLADSEKPCEDSEELTEFEKAISQTISSYMFLPQDVDHCVSRKDAHDFYHKAAKKLLSIARKQIANEISEIEHCFTQSDDVDDIISAYHDIQNVINKLKRV